MDNWPRIPRSQTAAAPSRSGGTSLPPPGTVVIASVEEELGDGMYALRWAGNRIAVSSRVKLEPGQSLILKSEVSAEGKSTLVVQGPALPQTGQAAGRFLYGPPEHAAPAPDGQPEQGGRQSVAATPERGGAAMAATTTTADVGSGASSRTEGTLVGAILEPLPEFATRADALLREAAQEIETLKREGTPVASAGISETDDGAEGQPPAPSGEKPAASTSTTPAAVPGSSGEKPPAPESPSQPVPVPLPAPSGEKPVASAPVVVPGSGGEKSPTPESPSQPVPVPLPAPSGEQPVVSAPVVVPGSGGEKPPAPENPSQPVPVPLPAPSGEKPVVSAPVVVPGSGGEKPPAPESPSQPVPVPLPAPSGEKPVAPAEKREDVPAAPPRVENSAGGKQPVPPAVRPEVLLKEALTQLFKAADLPLSDAAASGRLLGVGGKMPEAVAEKAAAILLRGAGLSPDAATLEAAKALLENGAQIDRQTILALISLAAGTEEGERAAVLKAAARLAARDVPLSPPLVAGLADVLRREGGVSHLLDRTVENLAVASAPEEVKPLLRAAGEMLELLRVDLDQPDAAPALARYLSSFGRETLGKALALVETSAQALLETHPVLPKIDAAITALLLAADTRDAGAAATPPAGTAPPTPSPVPGAPEAVTGGNATPPVVPGAGAGLGTPPLSSAVAPPGTPPPSGSGDAPAAGTPPAVSGDPDSPDVPVAPPPASSEEENAPPTETPRPAAGVYSPINAYLRSPRAFPGLASLNLPPMPKVVTLASTGIAADASGIAAASGAPVTQPALGETVSGKPVGPGVPTLSPPDMEIPVDAGGVPQSGKQPPADGKAPSPRGDLPVDARTPQGETPETTGGKPRPDGEAPGEAPGKAPAPLLSPEARDAGSSLLRRLDALIFQTPGLNRPEVELLRPGGFFDRFFNADSGGAASGKTAAEAQALARELLSEDPEAREQALRELPRREQAVLRETAARLSRMEREILRAEPTVSRLSEAASSLRDLGRQLLAVKAENLAGQEREPAVMLAETPFKLADQSGEGRMQMFYRKSAKKADGWTSRVILDLNTTGMGPVLGDMRFFGSDMILNLFVGEQKTADFLSTSADALADALLEKGFRLKSRFLVLPPPPAIRAERPVVAGETATDVPGGEASIISAPSARRGKLDVKG